jgi:hypothetical protein
MDELTKCLHCKGRGYQIRWSLREQITDPLYVHEPCQRCNGTGRMTTLLQTVPVNAFSMSPSAGRLPWSTDAKDEGTGRCDCW